MPVRFKKHWPEIISEVQAGADRILHDASLQPQAMLRDVEALVSENQGRVYAGFVSGSPSSLASAYVGKVSEDDCRLEHALAQRFSLVACNYRGQLAKDARLTTFLVNRNRLIEVLGGIDGSCSEYLDYLYRLMLLVYFEVFQRDRTFTESLLDACDAAGEKNARPQHEPPAKALNLADYGMVSVHLWSEHKGAAQNGIDFEVGEAQAERGARALAIHVAPAVCSWLLQPPLRNGEESDDPLGKKWIETIWDVLLSLGAPPDGADFPRDIVSEAATQLRRLRPAFDRGVVSAQGEIKGDRVCDLAEAFFPDMGRYRAVSAFIRMIQGILCHVGLMGRDVVSVIARPNRSGLRSCSVTLVSGEPREKEDAPVPWQDGDLRHWLELAEPYASHAESGCILVIVKKPLDAVLRDVDVPKPQRLDHIWAHPDIEDLVPNWLPNWLWTRLVTFVFEKSGSYFPYWFELANLLRLACRLAGEYHEGFGLDFAWVMGPPEILKRVDGTVSNEDLDFWRRVHNDEPYGGFATTEDFCHQQQEEFEATIGEACSAFKAHFGIFQVLRAAAYVDPIAFPSGLGLSRIVRLPYVSEEACAYAGLDYGPMASYAYASTGFQMPNERRPRGDTCAIVSRPARAVTLFMCGEEVAEWRKGEEVAERREGKWRAGRDLRGYEANQRSMKLELIEQIRQACKWPKESDNERVVRMLSSVLAEISDEPDAGALVALVSREPSGVGEALFFDLTPDRLMMKWGKKQPLSHMSREVLRSLLVMDGATVITADDDLQVSARKQLAADRDVFRALQEQEAALRDAMSSHTEPDTDLAKQLAEQLADIHGKLLEAITFGTKHRSALAFRQRLTDTEGVDGIVITVSEDGPVRVFHGNTWTKLGSRGDENRH